ncbi:hypothetical protein LTR66_007276 [Elasticomyces elasticus]|nr:hypothetical protein LTR66_007276 [Elasticomyces elasticus]
MLAPFDLASISTKATNAVQVEGFESPDNLPPVARRIVYLGLRYAVCATKERDAAGKLLVRLSTRPDMQALKLPKALVSWAVRPLSKLSDSVHNASHTIVNIHVYLGALQYLAGLTSSVSSAEIGGLIPSIYRTCQAVTTGDAASVCNTSAVAKKLLVKILRSVCLMSLQPASGSTFSRFLEGASVLEDVIDFLLQSLADRDTPVRYAASKALSMIVLKLDQETAPQVVQAILGASKEDVGTGPTRSLAAVNPSRWHGLTLALAHIVFRRCVSPDQLPDVLDALMLALDFEQRSTTGGSIGTNVRDAANFGIWSVARRYSTKELLATNPPASMDGSVSTIQGLATRLLVSACFDPAGNIRRGSSAALQELVGRHPDEIVHGIRLVQIVDYNAVGLRRRAMIDVASAAAKLDDLYWDALVDGLIGWRGIGSVDVPSRDATGSSLGLLCASQPFAKVQSTIETIRNKLEYTSDTGSEPRHALILALSCIINEAVPIPESWRTPWQQSQPIRRTSAEIGYFTKLWSLYGNHVRLPASDSSLRDTKSELPIAIAQLVASLGRASFHFQNLQDGSNPTHPDPEISEAIVRALLNRGDEHTLQILPAVLEPLLRLKRESGVDFLLSHTELLQLCDRKVRAITRTANPLRQSTEGAGYVVALGFLYNPQEHEPTGVNAPATLRDLVTAPVSTEWRVVAVTALRHVILPLMDATSGYKLLVQDQDCVTSALHFAMNDYTISERGDVGSLVRLKAIECMEIIGAVGLLRSEACEKLEQILYADLTRLSLEKLDRVRLQAARCILQFRQPQSDYSATSGDNGPSPGANSTAQGLPKWKTTTDLNAVSRAGYFEQTFRLLANCPPWHRTAILRGCISVAGSGSSEALLQASRSALVDTMFGVDIAALDAIGGTLLEVFRDLLTVADDTQPLLEVVGFLLDAQVLQRLDFAGRSFRWRTLLALVQKSHFKSNSIPKLLAAISVYRGLAGVSVTHGDVMKKLVGMLRTNPYPKVCIIFQTIVMERGLQFG